MMYFIVNLIVLYVLYLFMEPQFGGQNVLVSARPSS